MMKIVAFPTCRKIWGVKVGIVLFAAMSVRVILYQKRVNPTSTKYHDTSQARSHVVFEKEQLYPGVNELREQARDIKYLANYKSPCWEVQMDETRKYSQNLFWKYEDSREFLKHMEQTNIELLRSSGSLTLSQARVRCLPYAYILGVNKCSTTDLFAQLQRHPQVASPLMKEVKWWCRERQTHGLAEMNKVKHVDQDTVGFLGHYLDFFDGAALKMQLSNTTLKQDVIIDGSPTTFWHVLPYKKENVSQNVSEIHLSEPGFTTPHYMKALQPDVKLILLLRNPTERLFKEDMQKLSMIKRTLSADRYHSLVAAAVKDYQQCFADHGHRACALNRQMERKHSQTRLVTGLYSVFLREWLSVYPREQFYILITEEYDQYTVRELNKTLKFLDLDLIPKEDEHIYKSIYYTKNGIYCSKMPEKTRWILDEFYAPFNKDLAQILNDNRFLFQSQC